jgi:hypothetical protein
LYTSQQPVPGKAKKHCMKLVQCKKLAWKFEAEKLIIRASRDYKICPHKTRSILVEGFFEEDKE